MTTTKRAVRVLALSALLLLSVAPVPASAADPLRVGVVDSESTFINFHQLGFWQGRPTGTATALGNAGYTVVHLRDADLVDRSALDSLDVLVLPMTRVMSEEATVTVQSWVEDGGGLVAAFIAPRMLNRPGCHWTLAAHPRDLADPESGWTCPVSEFSHGGFDFWFRVLNSNVWEFGPLSHAYQKRFINDPTPKELAVIEERDSGGNQVQHPIVQGTLQALGITSIRFDRPDGAGAEFSRLFNGNTTSLLEFEIEPGTMSVEGVEVTEFDGYTAGQATLYGWGRIVYFDFGLLDSLPEVNGKQAAYTHQGVTQGEIALELLGQSIDWAAQGNGSFVATDSSARAWGEVDASQGAIHVRHRLEADGNMNVLGDAHIRIYDPAGVLVFSQTKSQVGMYPGLSLLYSWSYMPGTLADGQYRVEVDYLYSYPWWDRIHLERALVSRGQGKDIPTSVVYSGPLGPRLAGDDRYGTAAAVSEDAFPASAPVAYVATGLDFPDALAGGPAAAGQGPILLVHPDRIPSQTAEELQRLKPGEIKVLGGTGAVSVTVEGLLDGYTSGPVTRLAGSNRYATAAAVSKATFGKGVPVAYVATGENFPDALAGGPVAGLRGGPILLTAKDTLPVATANELSRLEPQEIVILGGTGAVSAAVEAQLDGYTSGPVTRLAGNDRFQTAAAISGSLFGPGVDVAYVATGENFPDALAGGPAGTAGEGPILLVRRDSIPAATHNELLRLRPKEIVVLGGSAVVSDAVRAELVSYLGS